MKKKNPYRIFFYSYCWIDKILYFKYSGAERSVNIYIYAYEVRNTKSQIVRMQQYYSKHWIVVEGPRI